VTLPDGRTLAYAEYGDLEGRPSSFHGTPGSRVSASVARETMTRAGVRLIAPERPGFGHSEYTPDWSFADWADDVAALTDALGVAEYGVVGVAAGGPYALGCAAHTPSASPGVRSSRASRHRRSPARRRRGSTARCSRSPGGRPTSDGRSPGCCAGESATPTGSPTSSATRRTATSRTPGSGRRVASSSPTSGRE